MRGGDYIDQSSEDGEYDADQMNPIAALISRAMRGQPGPRYDEVYPANKQFQQKRPQLDPTMTTPPNQLAMNGDPRAEIIAQMIQNAGPRNAPEGPPQAPQGYDPAMDIPHGMPSDDTQPLPLDEQGFERRYGREPATDGEMEYYRGGDDDNETQRELDDVHNQINKDPVDEELDKAIQNKDYQTLRAMEKDGFISREDLERYIEEMGGDPAEADTDEDAD